MAILSLVPLSVSQEALAAARQLVREIEAGDCTGFACICIGPGLTWSVDAVGIARMIPHYTRGLLLELNDRLSSLGKDDRA